MEIIIEDLKYEDIEECYNLNKIIFNEEYGLDDVKDLYLKLYNFICYILLTIQK